MLPEQGLRGPRSLEIQTDIAEVLVVDDHSAICRIVQLMLPDELYCVEASHSVADALGAVANRSFDVYVLDYKLQDGSGFDVAERIRSKWGAVPIVLMSGYDSSELAVRSEKLGIIDFLEKPFSQKSLCNALKNALESSRANTRRPFRN
jgi:two-component system, NtrC family, response regulator HydG